MRHLIETALENYYRTLRSDMRPSLNPMKKGQILFGTMSEKVALYSFVGTVIPIIPYTFWGIIHFSPIDRLLSSTVPFSVHALVWAYAFSVLLCVLGFSWLLIDAFRQRPEMTELQTLFFLTFDTLDAMRCYQINSRTEHLQRAKDSLSALHDMLQYEDPRSPSFQCPLVRVPDQALLQLDLVLAGCARVQDGLDRVEFPRLRSVLQPLSVIFFAYLPDLSTFLDGKNLSQVQVEADAAWSTLEICIEQLPAPKQRRVEHVPADPPKKGWLRLVGALVANLLLAALITVVLAAGPFYLVWNKTSSASHDTVMIGGLTATLAVSGALAVALFNKGLFQPEDQMRSHRSGALPKRPRKRGKSRQAS